MSNRYRIWKKDGTYEVAVANNRQDAIDEVMERYHLTEDKLSSASIVSSKNTRMFKI